MSHSCPVFLAEPVGAPLEMVEGEEPDIMVAQLPTPYVTNEIPAAVEDNDDVPLINLEDPVNGETVEEVQQNTQMNNRPISETTEKE